MANSNFVVKNGITVGALSVAASNGNLTTTGSVTSASLDISGNADIDGTMEADAYTVDGTALNEYIADTVGAMVGSNTETNIAVTYEDGDNTLDFVIGTLNQDTTGLAGTATALATGRTIGMTGDVVWTSASFDGTGNVTGTSTIQANSVDLGSMTTGSYISTITGTANEIEVAGSGSETATVTIGLPDDVTVGGVLTVTGNLVVNGTTTTVNSTNTTLDDNLLELNSGAGSNANDSGIIIERGSTGDNAIIMWDESADKFTVGTTTATASDTGNLTITTGTLVANLEGNVTGNVTGNVSGSSGSCTGNAATASAWASARTITLGGDLSGSVSLDGSANVTLTATVASNTVALGTDTTGNYVAAGATSGNGISGSVASEGGTFTVTSNATNANTASTIVFRDGSGNFSAGTITGTATAAQYADLAERYEAEAPVEPGTVVHFGGSKEVKECDNDMCPRVAGIVSTNPAHLMNEAAGDDTTHPAIALRGRVPCKVQGSVKKGDMMVSAGNGRARAEANPVMGSLLGKALADSEGDAVIEVVV